MLQSNILFLMNEALPFSVILKKCNKIFVIKLNVALQDEHYLAEKSDAWVYFIDMISISVFATSCFDINCQNILTMSIKLGCNYVAYKNASVQFKLKTIVFKHASFKGTNQDIFCIIRLYFFIFVHLLL